MAPILEVNHLTTCFHGKNGIVPAVEGVSFDVEPGRTLGIVGESGCGKSVTALSILKPVSYTHLDVYKRQHVKDVEHRRVGDIPQ